MCDSMEGVQSLPPERSVSLEVDIPGLALSFDVWYCGLDEA